MRSLRESQQAFAEAVLTDDGAVPAFSTNPANAVERLAIYRRAIFANYRRALGATYPVVKKLVGAPFFDAAAGAFVRAHPSRSGDLNVYGGELGDFLESYAPAADLQYLPDVARLEWAIDEAGRAADDEAAPAAVLAAFSRIAPELLPGLHLALASACRTVVSPHPVLRIWQVNQSDAAADARVSLDEGGVTVLVRRDARGVSLLPIAPALCAWLAALAEGATLGAAIDAAQAIDAAFDLGAALRDCIADGTIAGIVAEA
jgi:hypothetical protein